MILSKDIRPANGNVLLDFVGAAELTTNIENPVLDLSQNTVSFFLWETSKFGAIDFLIASKRTLRGISAKLVIKNEDNKVACVLNMDGGSLASHSTTLITKNGTKNAFGIDSPCDPIGHYVTMKFATIERMEERE